MEDVKGCYDIVEAITSTEALVGGISALGVIILPLFVEFKTPYKIDKWYKKVLYVLIAFGIGVGCKYKCLDIDTGVLIGVCIGWPKLVAGVLQTAIAVNKAKEVQNSQSVINS
jgi:hypothetical protein